MQRWKWCAVAVLGGALLVGSARTASAEMTGTTCSASGTWQSTGTVVDVKTATGTVTVPRSDSVAWEGSVTGPPGEYAGSIWVVLPPPFGTVEIDSWQGDSTATSNSGVEDYDLPGAVPAGVRFTVKGEHTDANGICTGTVQMVIDGSRWSSPILWGSLLGTAVTGLAGFTLVRPLFRRVV